MKLLLDENLPHDIRRLLMPTHEVFTVAFMKWRGVSNGKLLSLAAVNGFDAVITTDRGIEHEQNTANLPCAVVLLAAGGNTMDDLRPLIPQVLEALISLRAKSLVRIEAATGRQ